MKIRKLLFLLCIIATARAHKIVYLISPPRSLSVAFLRIMDNTGHFKIFHEPSQYMYWPNKAYYTENVFTTYQQVKEAILTASETQPVFVKELSYSAQNFLLNDKDFVTNPAIQFVILLRNPHHTALSLYKKIPIVQYNLDELLGYKSIFAIFKTLKNSAAHEPIIIFTEDIYNKPEETIRAFCHTLDIPFTPEILSWQSVGNNFTGQQEWTEVKHAQHTHYWHEDALKSTGIHQPHSYKTDAAGLPTFEEVALEYRQLFINTYKEHKKYYDKLCKETHFHLKI